MGSSRSFWGGARGIYRLGIVALAVLVLAIPPTGSAHPLGGHPTVLAGPVVTWDGADISQASTVASAFVVTTGETVLVNFSYPVPVGDPGGSTITTARLLIYYFGAAISANSVPATAGTALMNWSLGTYTYLLQGVYRMTASLINGNGTTAWSENFYIDARAPYRIGSGITVFLFVLGGVELWSIATSSSRRWRPKPKPGGPPTPWEPAPPPAAGPPAGPGPAPPTPPASPPASGGGS